MILKQRPWKSQGKGLRNDTTSKQGNKVNDNRPHVTPSDRTNSWCDVITRRPHVTGGVGARARV